MASLGGKLDIRHAQLAFEIDDLTGIGALKSVSCELQQIASQEQSQRDKEYRPREQSHIDGEQQHTQDGGRNADDMEDEADPITMSFHPVGDEPMRRLGRTNHETILGRPTDHGRLTNCGNRVSFAGSYYPAQSWREWQAGGTLEY